MTLDRFCSRPIGTLVVSMQGNPDSGVPENSDVIPLKMPLLTGTWTPSNAWFLGPTKVNIQNGITIGLAAFAGLTVVTDRQADRPRYFVCRNMPHLASDAMRPKNKTVAILNACRHIPSTLSWATVGWATERTSTCKKNRFQLYARVLFFGDPTRPSPE